MTKKPLPNPKIIDKLLRYHPETGKLFWKSRAPDMFTEGYRSKEHNCNIWNAKNAGNEAFKKLDATGYKRGCVLGVYIPAHWAIWAIIHGVWPADQIDHINHDRSDNRVDNLRTVTRLENLKNRTLFENNKSGVCGVSRSKNGEKWVATIFVGGKRHHLGTFSDKYGAIRARENANIKHGFHPNHGRSITRNDDFWPHEAP